MKRPQSPVSRAHDKLGAALARFDLAAAIPKARVLDLSASTPGYAALLLERGASQVGSLDLGPCPLAPKLRGDARLSFVERANLKLLPAASLPGPFSFFLIDLRFAASRTALRAIAFRLDPASEGLAWLKPRFEVPAEQVRGGGLTAPGLREHALRLFSEKALALGYTIAATVDVPSADGEGEEILIHLRYRRPPAAAPRPAPSR